MPASLGLTLVQGFMRDGQLLEKQEIDKMCAFSPTPHSS
jgi:hypothetical protein